MIAIVAHWDHSLYSELRLISVGVRLWARFGNMAHSCAPMRIKVATF